MAKFDDSLVAVTSRSFSTNQFLVKKLKELISNYKTTFNTDTGKMVLEDLKKRSHFYNTTHVKGDSHESAFYEGQRSLVVFIEKLINQKE